MIKKAIIPIAGLGTRFLPLSKAVPKELWPLAGVPLIQYAIKETKDAGIREIIFVLNSKSKKVFDYLKPLPKIEKTLKEKKREEIWEEVKRLDDLLSDISFSYTIQKNPLGDGHAILQANKLINSEEPIAVLFPDDIIESRQSAISQLANTFKTCQKPVIALSRKPEDVLSHYGVVRVEKIAHKYFKIKNIIEKPKEEAPSNLAVIGRYILTPEVFSYLKKAKPGKNKEIILAEVFNNQMIAEGKLIYGYEIEGDWFECGDKLKWLKSNLYFSLKHPKYGSELRDYLKKII